MSKYLDQDGLLYLWQKIKAKLSDKVDKVTGKGLSTNDYSDAEKAKVAASIDSITGTGTSTTINYTKNDGTTGSFTTKDTTYSDMTAATSSKAGTHGLVPAPGAGKQASFLRGDGTWVVPTNTNTTYTLSGALSGESFVNTLTPSSGTATTSTVPKMGAASDSEAGTAGLVPAPAKGDQNKFLKADGTWAEVPDDNTTYTLSGSLNGNTYDIKSTPSSGNVQTATVPAMAKATSSAAGKAGLVPAPAKGNQAMFLRGDATWATPTDSKVNVTLANTSKAFLLATTTTPSSTAAGVTAVADSGVYLDTEAGKLTAGSFAGNGAALTSLNGSNVSSGTVPASHLPSMTGATASAAGTAGIVPAPSAGDQNKFLNGAGEWGTPSFSDTKVNVTLATTTKAFLLGVTTTPTATATGMTAVSDSGVYLDTTAGKLTAGSFAGNGASLTSLNASNLGSGTVPAARLPAASQSANGAMSKEDKKKLDAFGSASDYALKSDIVNMYKFKGSKATVADLPSTGNVAGDVWNVEASGMNYAWDGSAWDALGEIFTIASITNAEIDEILAA